MLTIILLITTIVAFNFILFADQINDIANEICV